MPSDRPPSFSRSGATEPLGKNSEEVKTLVPAEMKERLQALATVRGVPLSEYVREVLLQHVYGEFAVLQLRAHGRNRPGTGQE